MPLYEYECGKCEKIHEVIQKFSDAPLSLCPDCQSPVKKRISMSAFSLKGNGWYVTDYKRSGASAPSSSDAKPVHDSSTQSETSRIEKTKAPHENGASAVSGTSAKSESKAPALG